MDILLGMDVGTQSLRVCAFDTNGNHLAEEVIPFCSMREPAPSFAEQSPDEWWNAAVTALRRISSAPELSGGRFVALSYGCTSCTAVFLDSSGVPVRPALMWMDHRSVKEAETVYKTGSPVLPYAGGNVSSEWMLPKLMWLKKNEPQTLEASAHIFEQTDFFTYKLTGKITISYNHLVAKWNYAIPAGGWPEGFLEELGLAELREKFPQEICFMGEVVGTISAETSALTGLPADMLVIQGGMDSTAGMIGLGAYNVGEIGMSHGTSTVLQCQFDRFVPGLRGRPDALTKGLYLIGGGETSTGAVAQWWVKQLSEMSNIAYSDFYGFLESKIAEIPAGSDGLLIQEHFQGSRTIPDQDSRGIITGLTLFHSSAHILRAIYESIAYGTRRFLDQLTASGYPLKRITVGGGLTKSCTCIQILADVIRMPVYRVKEKEHGALGAAILAGAGAGVFPGITEGIERMVHYSVPVQPNPENRDIYDFYYGQYCRLYGSTKEIIHNVVDFERKSVRKI